jgi:Aspartyl/Asparaginyl beta-hydroxylase
MCKEYDAMRAKLSGGDYALQSNEHALHSKDKGGDWKWQSLMQKGTLTPQAGLLAPFTTSLLMQTPLMTDVPFGYAFFSAMAPNTTIAPHFGPTNLRLRLHIPLRVPAEDEASIAAGNKPLCGIQVGGETRRWEVDSNGTPKPLVFDDAYEHSTWNRPPLEEGAGATSAAPTMSEEEKESKTRLILLFDVWHPELKEEEIQGLTGLFAEAKAKGWLSK